MLFDCDKSIGDDDDDENDDDDKDMSLTEWVPSLSLTDRLLMSCLHHSLIKLSLIYDGGDSHHDDRYNESDDSHQHHR